MSENAYRMSLMQRALARTDSELFGNRRRFVERAQRIAAAVLSNT